jgi:hypothetical protein
MAVSILLQVTNAGGNIVLDGTNFASQTTIEIYAATGVTLAADWHMEINPSPPDGTVVNYIVALNSPFNLNGHTFDIDSVNFTQDLIDVTPCIYHGRKFYVESAGGTVWSGDSLFYGYLNPALLPDEGVTLAKIEDLTRGHIIVGNSSGRPTSVDFNNSGYIGIGDGTDYNSVAQSGDVIFSNAGVSAIQTGVIVNADVNASAAITRSKLASGTADYVVINSGTGVMSQEAQLANSRGGTGLDSSASTGFPTISSGTWSAAAIAVDRDLDVSFEAGEVGDFKIYMGFAGTLTNIYAYATKVIAGTDNGTIVPKNNAGTTMATGTVTFTASDARGTAYTVTPSTNNTFVAGDILTFTTAKVTAGGKVHLSLKFTRTA